ncbi:RNA pseudouridine synthase 6 [Hibiscus syriacus]|uniref:RNA pseudouridine synthase 6 n=1 Tax=Hibiscus syriacus TaxID=106335 RepID=A0A6A3BYK8_HIBSY|nr:RNA pseudouridine synthase 6 [Hibiscus syriacus]
MNLGSASAGLASIFSNGYRSLSAPVSSLRTLASSSLYKHYKSNSKSAILYCWSSSKRELSFFSSRVDVVQTAATSSVNGYPKYDRLLPCPSDNGPPRVEHLVVSEGGPVLEYICKALDLPPLSHPFLSCILCPPTTDSYVVLDKPAGTSVGGTTDNIEESCATFASRSLGFSTPLKTTHQIDNCTEGCVVLARTKEYCSVFHGKIREKKVKKLYLALTAAPVPIGIITHYMRPINMAPRLVSEDFVKGWYLCQLEVMECMEVPWPDSVIQENYCIEDSGWPLTDHAYEYKINLLTGRTHQVRAQLAAFGAPIVGDSMYMPAAIAEIANPGLNPFGKYKEYTGESDKEMAVTKWIAQFGKEPSVAIGLQACQISWDDGEHSYEARSPWWRSTMA